MDLSIAKLRQLVTVARSGSFSRAAADLNLSQPALSRSIASIEQRYGFPIFNRLGHGVEPTFAGAQVIALAEPLLQAMHVFDSNLKLMGSGKAGRLAIGFTPLLASQILAQFAGAFLGPGSEVQLTTMIRPGEQLLSALKDDTIELFFFPEAHIGGTDEVEVEVIGHVAPLCVVRAGHPLLGLVCLTKADLSPYPWASSVETHLAPVVLSEARMTCDNYHVLRDVVLSTDTVCICTRDFVADELASGALCELQVDDLPLRSTTMFLARLPGRMHSPLALEAIECVRSFLAKAALT